jgi:hypothetical protein
MQTPSGFKISNYPKIRIDNVFIALFVFATWSTDLHHEIVEHVNRLKQLKQNKGIFIYRRALLFP